MVRSMMGRTARSDFVGGGVPGVPPVRGAGGLRAAPACDSSPSPCRRLRRVLLPAPGLVLVCLLATFPVRAAGPVRVPPLAPREQGEYLARDARTGEDLWRTRWDVEEEITNGITRIRAEEEGRGHLEGTGLAAWRVRVEATFSGGDRRFASRREIRDDSGRLLRGEDREFDYGAGTGRIAITDGATGRTVVQQIAVETTSIAAEMLATQLRLLPDTEGRRMRFSLITRDGKVVAMEARILGQEMVTVPAGRFECYKIEVDPAGFRGVLADLFLPRIFMWHTVAAPHFWVKYQGPDEGRLSREIIRELAHFESHPAATP